MAVFGNFRGGGIRPSNQKVRVNQNFLSVHKIKRGCHLLLSFRGEREEVKSGVCMGESGGVWGAQKLALNRPYQLARPRVGT